MPATFNQVLEEIRLGAIELLRLNDIITSVNQTRALSVALMSKKNKVNKVYLLCNDIENDGARSLSLALMNEYNKVTPLNLLQCKIGDDGARSLSTALMNENNKVALLDLSANKIGKESSFESRKRSDGLLI